MIAECAIVSPPSTGNAAIAIVELRGDVAGMVKRLGAREVCTGEAVLRTIPDVDTLIIARTADDHAFLFPHAGPEILRRLLRALARCGATVSSQTSERGHGDSAESMDDRLTRALQRAASPLAIDLLLAQPARWRALHASAGPNAKSAMPEAHIRALHRLIVPPVVIALGPPNVGKSSLLNALTGRSVSIVADEPGTTRDHVGAMVDLAGLTVRWIDAPGIEPRTGRETVQAAAQDLALQASAGADLLLLCCDAASPDWPTIEQTLGQARLRVLLRSDLGLPSDGRTFDLTVNVREPGALESLVARVRETLVPAAALADPSPWPFWEAGRQRNGGRDGLEGRP